MSAPDELAWGILDVLPVAPETVHACKVATYWPNYADGGVGGITIRLNDREFPCGWLDSLNESARTGAISVGTTVLAMIVGGTFVVIGVLKLPASLTSQGGTA